MGKCRKNEWEIRNTQKYDRKTNTRRIVMVGLDDYNKNNKNNIIIISCAIIHILYVHIPTFILQILYTLHALAR